MNVGVFHQEGHEFGRGVAGGRLAQDDLAGLGVEGGVQRERAVPVVLEAMALGASRRQRQHRVLAIQRLNRSLLIHAEHRRVLLRFTSHRDPGLDRARGLCRLLDCASRPSLAVLARCPAILATAGHAAQPPAVASGRDLGPRCRLVEGAALGLTVARFDLPAAADSFPAR